MLLHFVISWEERAPDFASPAGVAALDISYIEANWAQIYADVGQRRWWWRARNGTSIRTFNEEGPVTFTSLIPKTSRDQGAELLVLSLDRRGSPAGVAKSIRAPQMRGITGARWHFLSFFEAPDPL